MQSLPTERDGCETVTPATEHLFKVNLEGDKLDRRESEIFHHYVAKLLFASERAHPDVKTSRPQWHICARK